MQPYLFVSVGIQSKDAPNGLMDVIHNMPLSSEIEYYGFSEDDNEGGIISFSRIQCPFSMDDYADTKAISTDKLAKLLQKKNTLDEVSKACEWLRNNGFEDYVNRVSIYIHVSSV